jgi:nitrite reductase/ring-hydroxylating ferredoxin subunit
MNDETTYQTLAQDTAGDRNKVQALLAEETVPVPAHLASQPANLGHAPIAAARYLSRDFHEREKQRLWPRVWQFACREEQLGAPGDYEVYDIAGRSVLVVRGEDRQLRAFHNACLHRGRALRHCAGHAAELRCPFHGFTWALDGSFRSLPCAWDFRHLDRARMQLPQLRCETWGGFVFVCFDDQAPPLLEYLGVLPQHFADYGLEHSCTLLHVQKRIPCNWKVGQEAFFESMHSRTTHPHILTFIADVDSQYDVFGAHISRMITPSTVPSSHLSGVSEARILRDSLAESGRMATSEADKHQLPPGMSARRYIGELNRRIFGELAGRDLAQATLCELQDAILYSVFPNLQIWAGYFGNIVYRFIPDGDDPGSCLFDVRLLGRFPEGQPRPKAPQVHRLGDDESFADAPELGALAPVFDQDMRNLPYMMKGLASLRDGQIQLAGYQELRIRHHHRTLDRYLEDGP